MSISRRNLLKMGIVSGSGLTIGVSTLVYGSDAVSTQQSINLHPLIRITTDNDIILFAQNPEMGQGVKTSLTMIIAEELDVNWNDIKVQQADWIKGEDLQFSGGSLSVRLNYEAMRNAGATGRQMLLLAAATVLKVPVEELTTAAGQIIHAGTKKKINYGAFANLAAMSSIPSQVPTKDKTKFKIIGKNKKDVDLKDIIQGSQVYSLDVKLPGMLYANFQRSPWSDGQPLSVDDTDARDMKGFISSVMLRNDQNGGRILKTNSPNFVSGVAAIAKDSWTAVQAAKKLRIKWQKPNNTDNSDKLISSFNKALQQPARIIRKDGQLTVHDNLIKASVDSKYQLPFLAHVTMEPMNCTVDVTDKAVTVWAPTQNPADLAKNLAEVLNIKEESICIHLIRCGGAFGRRFYADFVVDAAILSQQLKRPIKVIWSREEDIQHDYYRPASMQQIKASLDKNNQIISWHHKVASYPRTAFLGRSGPHSELDDYEFPAGFIKNLQYEYAEVPASIPIGQWRAVEHSSNVFVASSVIDELAFKAGIDPLNLWKNLIGDKSSVQVLKDFTFDASRLSAVVDTIADYANWHQPLTKGMGRGISASYNQGAWIAMVAEVYVEGANLQIKQIYAVVDCGIVINPTGAEAQIQGGIVEGLSAALFGKITIKDGIVEQSNFHNYNLCRINQVPNIQVKFMASDAAPRGLGEAGLPPVAPAVCNAIFNACGSRIKSLPVKQFFSVSNAIS